MRLMTWCLGVLVLFADHGAAESCGHAVTWEWYTMLLLWFLVGLTALVVSVVRIVSAKVKAGTLRAPGMERVRVPAERSDD